MKMGLLYDKKNTNLEDQEESLLGSASNDQGQLKMNLGMGGFFYKLYQQRAFKMRKKMMTSKYPLVRVGSELEKKKKGTLELELPLFHNKSSKKKGKVEMSSPFIEIKGGSHNLTNLMGLKHGFQVLG